MLSRIKKINKKTIVSRVWLLQLFYKAVSSTEVICPPLADYSSNIWKPKTRKLLDLSCEKGFYLSGYDISFGTFKVEGNQIEFECSNKGIWLPNPNFFYCARELLHEIKLSHSLKNEPITDAQCTRPPDVASAEHTGYHSSVEFDYGSKLSYYCIPGSSIYYMFALYNKAYNLCLHQGKSFFLKLFIVKKFSNKTLNLYLKVLTY